MKTVNIRSHIINALVHTLRHFGLDAYQPEGSEQYGYIVQVAGTEEVRIYFRQRICGRWYSLDAGLKVNSIQPWYSDEDDQIGKKISESLHHHPDCQCSICVHGADA